jgi:hypothetical protein
MYISTSTSESQNTISNLQNIYGILTTVKGNRTKTIPRDSPRTGSLKYIYLQQDLQRMIKTRSEKGASLTDTIKIES